MPATPAPVRRVIVWDLPLRIFHWLLAILILANLGLGWFWEELGVEDPLFWHARIGYAILMLLLFRIVWGFVGGTHARFTQFVRGPGAIVAYLKGAHPAAPGHNPLGALSVIALLLTSIFQAVSGLFLSNEDFFFEGPLYRHASNDTVNLLAALHEWNALLIVALVGVHVAAILFYRFVKGERLVGAMLHGRREFPADTPVADAKGGSIWLALIVLFIAMGAVWYLVMPAPAG